MSKEKMVIVSGCLVGINCKWDGDSKEIDRVISLLKEGLAIPVCPEQLGGLSTPRPPSGILNSTGEEVVERKARVVNVEGKDITVNFLKGCEEVLKLVQKTGIKKAILKKTSPCCGVGKTWQMRKTEKGYENFLVDGNGVLTELLRKNGIEVISEEDV